MIESRAATSGSHLVDAVIEAYDRRADELQAAYDRLDPLQVHQRAAASIIERSAGGGPALDIGAGSGRDARWLRRIGFAVTAVEPSAELRRRAAAHPDNGGIRWSDARLPDLTGIAGPFDYQHLSAVFMHVPPELRRPALARLHALAAPDGLVLVTLRRAAADDDRKMFPLRLDAFVDLARGAGFREVLVAENDTDLRGFATGWDVVLMTTAASSHARPTSSEPRANPRAHI